MASTSSKHQPPKARKRVDAGPLPQLKRGSNGSAFVKCESCSKDIPAAIVDMHDCVKDRKTMAFLSKPVENAAKETTSVPPKAIEVAKERNSQKRKSIDKSSVKTQQKRGKKEKDPNEPKRPATAFFLFMEEFRKSYKEANPNAKGGAAVAKEGGDKWKFMSEEEKAPFVAKAAELKEKYNKAVKAHKSDQKVGMLGFSRSALSLARFNVLNEYAEYAVDNCVCEQGNSAETLEEVGESEGPMKDEAGEGGAS